MLTPRFASAEAPRREVPPLRVCDPEVHLPKTKDGLQLRLTRYRGGDRGPVVLAHGLGVSSRIFSIDTIDTNLLEYLYSHGFDTWLLDYRVSIELPTSLRQSTADDVATKDYPAAVSNVLAVTGADSVDMVVHCYGATTFFMAMLAGLQGVRSAVCSQIATHIEAPASTRLKTGLRLPSIIKRFGIRTMTARVGADSGWLERLYDRALKLNPVGAQERCDSAVCRRISFMYSPLYNHNQLNAATHDALPEMFGAANMTAFQHLALLVRHGTLVTAEGHDEYLPHLTRLSIPITFIHGAMNACFLPKSTEITFELLQETNGRSLYDRHLVPNYGHIDCVFGKNAATDVYPLILRHLEGLRA